MDLNDFMITQICNYSVISLISPPLGSYYSEEVSAIVHKDIIPGFRVDEGPGDKL